MVVLDILLVTAPISTYFLFVSPIPTLFTSIRNASVDNLAPLPFLSGFLTGALWYLYAVKIDDHAVAGVSKVGAGLQLLYITIYFIFTSKKGSTIVKTAVAAAILAVIVGYANSVNAVTAGNHVGFLAAAVNVVNMGAPLAGLQNVVEKKSTADLPFPLIFMTFFVSLQWFLYGYILGDAFQMVPNACGIILAAVQLSLFLIYPSKPKQQ